MRILALESSGMHGSAALAESDRIVVEELVPVGQRTAAGLAPAVRRALAAAGWRPCDLDLIAVTVGPGSFTGLRVGVATAKSLAYALDRPLLGVDTLESLAARQPPSTGRILTALDAQRRELFVAEFERGPGDACRRIGSTVITAEAVWLAELAAPPGNLSSADSPLVVGPVLSRLNARLPPSIRRGPAELDEPSAAAVASCAWRDWQAGRRDDLWTLVPQYYRPSAAEEKRAALGTT